ncbi:MAG: oxygen-independent coproporphyrinogen III oxidase [Flavobacteriales bacterium]|nr:oxygen-independent coproporphyrinogen III oxidase [Flavobacteriales bacterium]
MNKLINKYNVAGPRYTSYPTVPYWNEADFTKDGWTNSLIRSFNKPEHEGLSIYVHLPFCERLCTFCGCHKRITKNHSVEGPYIDAVLKEWQLYRSILGEKPTISEIHFGGGTPTFFSVQNLTKLVKGLLEDAELTEDFEFGFEAHPGNTTLEQLTALSQLGFKRVSFGVQDYSPTVQKAINRIQSFEQVQRVHEWATSLGYTSISHDLIFGLPFQTIQDIESTIELTCQLSPDRLSFYSYAHVPWIKGVGQRGFSEADIPHGELKREFYEKGKTLLEKNGYQEVGMDHFAKKSDPLYRALQTGNLHRNFMGYTTNTTKNLIGLGMSAISDSWFGFAQNVKSVEGYISKIDDGQLPVFRGHILTREDLIIRQHILDLMCHFKTDLVHSEIDYQPILNRLKELINDQLLTIKNQEIKVTEIGIVFIRNICMCFDLHLHEKLPSQQLFSKTI